MAEYDDGSTDAVVPTPITLAELAVGYVDDLDDWIDGDDWVTETKHWDDEATKHVWVRFASGRQFEITFKETYE